jgi:hypothetical protein
MALSWPAEGPATVGTGSAGDAVKLTSTGRLPSVVVEGPGQTIPKHPSEILVKTDRGCFLY